MSDETKEIIESQMNDMRKELADMHTNVGRILECLDNMSEMLDRGVKSGLTPSDVDGLCKLYTVMHNSAKRC
jgi:hypothetical protein